MAFRPNDPKMPTSEDERSVMQRRIAALLAERGFHVDDELAADMGQAWVLAGKLIGLLRAEQPTLRVGTLACLLIVAMAKLGSNDVLHLLAANRELLDALGELPPARGGSGLLH